MLFRPLALLCAIAILAGLFLPWVTTPLGANIAPWDALPGLDRALIETFLTEAPNEVRLFLLSFVLAALFLLVSLIGLEKRWLAFLTGVCVVGLAGITVWRSREALGLVPPQWTMEEANRLFLLANDVLGTGGWAWVGGGALMLLLGVFDPGRAKPRVATASRW
ncbi:hypothetical protein [Tabrizicola sp.]|uniref:hypothetical protein n=1 Tax=Tabrizicola sp. TaxID=2005166 RepID=UPI002732E463|nr:hypothetical protein [Tabrizicola sp.]MDP3197919.1 hypothetical protein [Tabrizicola sp.]